MEHIFSINAIELASELAEAKVKDSFPTRKYLDFDEYTKTFTYTEEAQQLFNQYYDEYLTKIEETKATKQLTIQVYGVRLSEMPREDAIRFHLNLSDDDFMTSAEEQGYVWSLEGYTKQYNMDTLIKPDFIRFINLTEKI
jgi:hypothetical protein